MLQLEIRATTHGDKNSPKCVAVQLGGHLSLEDRRGPTPAGITQADG